MSTENNEVKISITSHLLAQTAVQFFFIFLFYAQAFISTTLALSYHCVMAHYSVISLYKWNLK